MMMKFALLVSALLAVNHALLFRQEKWGGLEVTFGVNLLDPYVFASMPRTESDAQAAGWTKIGDCDNTSKFRGRRYVKGGDHAVILLFDVNGHIGGIQSGRLHCQRLLWSMLSARTTAASGSQGAKVHSAQAPKSELSSDYPPTKQRGSIFQEDGDYWTLTAYFTDPATICTTGRSTEQFAREGTGNTLLIQNGSNPVTQSLKIPYLRDEVDRNTGWTLGHCFPGMGVHYWYSVTTDMSCDDFYPVFILYNEGVLTAFGWAMGASLSSKRYEHPPHATISAFMNPVPKCLSNYATLSTMHIYMTAHPSQDLC